jgi:hypothetical protein
MKKLKIFAKTNSILEKLSAKIENYPAINCSILHVTEDLFVLDKTFATILDHNYRRQAIHWLKLIMSFNFAARCYFQTLFGIKPTA